MLAFGAIALALGFIGVAIPVLLMTPRWRSAPPVAAVPRTTARPNSANGRSPDSAAFGTGASVGSSLPSGAAPPGVAAVVRIGQAAPVAPPRISTPAPVPPPPSSTASAQVSAAKPGSGGTTCVLGEAGPACSGTCGTCVRGETWPTGSRHRRHLCLRRDRVRTLRHRRHLRSAAKPKSPRFDARSAFAGCGAAGNRIAADTIAVAIAGASSSRDAATCACADSRAGGDCDGHATDGGPFRSRALLPARRGLQQFTRAVSRCCSKRTRRAPKFTTISGLLYQDRGEADRSIAEFQRALVLAPRYVKAHNNLGVAHLRAGRLEQAAAEFRVALTVDPRNVESLVNLALVQKAAGRPAEARDLLLRALAIDPRHPGSHYNLAVVADEAGDVATAVSHYRSFVKLGAVTHGELAAQVRARLALLDARSQPVLACHSAFYPRAHFE